MKLVASKTRATSLRSDTRGFLIWLGVAALLPPSCSLWVSSALSEKPADTEGGSGGSSGGSGGQGGSGASGGASSSTQSGSQSSSATSSSSSGELVCELGWANCDQAPGNGCEVALFSDDDNCGECHHVCSKNDECKGGKCK